MNDEIAGVDQHPVAGGKSLDPGSPVAGVLEGAQDVVGDGADMPVRAAGSDDKGVGDGTLASKVDEDDVLGLLVVEAFEDQVFEGGAVGGRGG